MDGEEVRIEESAGGGPCGTEESRRSFIAPILDRGPYYM
jgi:hypothetical protein